MAPEDSIEPTASTVQRGPAPPESVEGSRGSASEREIHVSDEAQTVIRGSSAAVRGGQAGQAPSPATPAIDRSPASVAKVLRGRKLNHFRLQELIGGGGMGAVFRAHDEHLDRVVAIKVIPFVGEDFDLGRRFRNEAQNAAKLDHPNIARVFDVGRHENWHYIVFEYVEGTNIRDRVLRDGAFSIDDAVFATSQLADAIGHAAERGIVHRDIKPSNVVVNLQEQIKLVDMGLARSENVELSEDMTASGVTLGTFDYISPEQALDPRDADIRSDIYSLGCTLYFMLTSRPPYPGGTMLQKLLSHGNAPPPDPRPLRRDISDDLAMVLAKMLAKSPDDRYQNVTDLMADLHEVASRERLSRSLSIAGPSPTADPAWGPAMQRAMPWLAAAAMLLLVAGWLQIHAMIAGDSLRVEVPESANLMLDSTMPGDSADAVPDAASQTTPDIDAGAPSDVGSSNGLAGDVETAPPGSPNEAAQESDSLATVAADRDLVSSGPGANDQGLEMSITGRDSPPDSVTSIDTNRLPPSSLPPRVNDVERVPLVDDNTAIPFDVEPPRMARVVDAADLEDLKFDTDRFAVDGQAYVDSLEQALALSDRYQLERIELATPVIRCGSLRVSHDQLEIVSVVGRTMLWLQ